MTERASYYFDSYYERWSLRHAFHKRRIDSLAQLSRVMEKLEAVKDVHTVAREAS